MPPLILQEAQRPSTLHKLKRRLRRVDALFLLAVALPVLVSSLYYGVIASDGFVSESRFVVRNPERTTTSGLGALLQGTTLTRAQDDAYAVHDFIQSRDALRQMEEKLKMREAYSRDGIDFVNRFPGLQPWDKSFEALYRHYLRHVEVDYDSASAISVLKVHGYSAEHVRQVNEMLLEMSEQLVNEMNARARRDLIDSAEKEVRVAEDRSKDAASALAAFRTDRTVFDPERQSTIRLQSAAKLRDDLLAAESQLESVRRVSPNNPQIGVLELRVKSLRDAVAEENRNVVGRGDGLSSKSPVYDRLVLERTFADRQLATALTALDTARSEAARKQLYLERLVQPHQPDMATEPRRLRNVFTVLVVGLILWGVLSLVVASVREHRD